MDNLDSIRFDGDKKRLTILFSDVRGFTTLTEKSDPARGVTNFIAEWVHIELDNSGRVRVPFAAGRRCYQCSHC
jgi:class 3 adenylate cyclase